MALFKPNPCKHCNSNDFYLKSISKYTIREYCLKCDRWKKIETERIDKSPSHCGNCKYFSETVFEGETANGHSSWDGDCLAPIKERNKTKSRYYGCIFGEFKDKKEVKK